MSESPKAVFLSYVPISQQFDLLYLCEICRTSALGKRQIDRTAHLLRLTLDCLGGLPHVPRDILKGNIWRSIVMTLHCVRRDS